MWRFKTDKNWNSEMMKRLLLYTVVLFSFSGYVKCQANDSITLYNNVLDYISRDLNVDIDSIAVSSIIYDLDSFFYIPVAESQEQKEMLIKRQNFSRGDFHSDILDSNFRKLSSRSTVFSSPTLWMEYFQQRYTSFRDLQIRLITPLLWRRACVSIPICWSLARNTR